MQRPCVAKPDALHVMTPPWPPWPQGSICWLANAAILWILFLPAAPATAGPPGSLHSWVGIIMYLPDSPDQRQAVTDRQAGPVGGCSRPAWTSLASGASADLLHTAHLLSARTVNALPTSCRSAHHPSCSFRQYGRLVEQELMAKYNATEHWAKIEVRQVCSTVGSGAGWLPLPLRVSCHAPSW